MIAGSACAPPPDDPRVVGELVHTLYGLVRTERLSPPVASRVYAYASTALYIGMASADPAQPDLTDLFIGLGAVPRADAGTKVDATLTALAATRVTLDSILREALPTTRSAVGRLTDSLKNARVAAGVSDNVSAQSAALGEKIGYAIVAWSHADGFDSTRGRPYTAPTGPGKWVNDNPASTYTTAS